MKELSQLTILHLDDDKIFSRYFQKIFKRHFNIKSFHYPVQAIEEIRKNKIDIVVTDFEMPEMNGLDFLKIIKEEFPFLPVIFYSNQGNEQKVREVFLAGASDYFNKDNLDFTGKEIVLNSMKNAWEKCRLQETLKKHQDELEELVKERTIQLEKELAERRKAEKDKALTIRILERLNSHQDTNDIIFDILKDLKDVTGYEAIGIRLEEGNNFPYFVYNGFSEEFVRLESCLCSHNIEDNSIRDNIFICLCGNIIQGNLDLDLPFMTPNGTFWTNSLNDLLKSGVSFPFALKDTCSRFGYNSIALIPLKSGEKIIGLLQINDSRPDIFTEEKIRFFEDIANSIGVSVARKQIEEALRKSEEFNTDKIDLPGQHSAICHCGNCNKNK